MIRSVPRTLAIAIMAIAFLVVASPALASRTTATFDYPVSVKGYQVKQTFTAADHPHVNGFITDMTVDIVDGQGKRVPIKRLMLHHIVFSKLGEPAPGCRTFTSFDADQKFPFSLARSFYAAGEERNELHLPPGYGLRLTADERWVMTWMLMNHRKLTDSAYIRWKVTYTTDEDLKPVHPYWLDVKNCHADPIFNVPGGGTRQSTYSKRYDFKVPESGHIVAAGGHVHGGARNLVISQPSCENRTIMTMQPAWGMPDNAFYHVRPILHEPGPIHVSQFASTTGFPVAAGEPIRLTANYENSLPHTRVMGIAIIYVAPSSGPVDNCGLLPADAGPFQTTKPHRTSPPRFRVPIVGIGRDGKAHDISHPPGRSVHLKSGAKIRVRNFYFSRRNVLVRRGARLVWNIKAQQSELHNVTLASGPRGFASPNYSDDRFVYRFRKRGKYKIFCALHPVSMTEVVTVR